MKFLIDECLSQRLTTMARDRGYVESSHVHWLGLGGIQDWTLIHRAIDEDWTLVTKNSYDFRGPARAFSDEVDTGSSQKMRRNQ